jgi:hypothetical protein
MTKRTMTNIMKQTCKAYSLSLALLNYRYRMSLVVTIPSINLTRERSTHFLYCAYNTDDML